MHSEINYSGTGSKAAGRICYVTLAHSSVCSGDPVTVTPLTTGGHASLLQR